jgi:threonine/homoserine/homoserine lactone efflux protein
LLYLGIRTFLEKPAENAAEASTTGSLFSMYTSTLLLTITNPATILSFVGIFVGLGVGAETGGYGLAALMVLGVFIGSAAWWLLLSGGVSLLRERFTPQMMVWVNRLSGTIIGGFGLIALGSLIATLI